MFKLESYITPILLSYVNKYVTNFRTEDSQVSLWGGEAVFSNLELNLQVLEQELKLPFSFVSGSIRELLIYVPWTSLASEPITITINTIECIFNLKGNGDKNRPESAPAPAEKNHRDSKEVEAPQGYVQLLINKIVSNIRIYCNNLILKYVEEDIVLSMNVKHLKFESADDKWEPAFIDISPAEVILRKVITINDLTLCLDKRNASGKIEIYQEPMLYKCSMTMHLLKNYHTAHAGIASTTRLDIYCNNMEFSMTEQQLPMFMRLIMLAIALQQKQIKSDTLLTEETSATSHEPGGSEDNTGSWSTWVWSYVSTVLPAPWDDELQSEEFEGFKGHTMHFGTYIDNLSITFKLSEVNADRYLKKMRYSPLLCLQLQGIYCETIIHGLKWCNSMGGISQAILLPMGACTCAFPEVPESGCSINYLKMGSESSSHKSDSLFDAEAVENNGERRVYDTSWDFHMSVYTESVLLERTPAFAFDSLYQMELPSDTSSEVLSELENDFEFSNFIENSNTRVCFGPFKLRICSGFFHRLSSLQAAADYYDYPPYTVPKPEKTLQDIHPPSSEDFDALSEFIPTKSMRITFFAPIIELELMDHPYFQPYKGMLCKKRKKISIPGSTPKPGNYPLPKLTVECQFLDIGSTAPMYVNRLVHTTCQLPDPPSQLFDACYTQRNIKVVGLCSRLILNPQRHTTILTPSSLSYTTRAIAKPTFWINPDITHEEKTFESENITLNGTNAKMMVVAYILGKMIKMDAEGGVKVMNSTSILSDASKDQSLPFMELCIESIRFKSVTTNSTVSVDMSLGSIKGFIFEHVHPKLEASHSNDIQQILFISGPDPKPSYFDEDPPEILKIEPQIQPLFTATFQFPLAPESQQHPPILLFNLQEIRICIDPLLCRWLLYSPKQYGSKQYYTIESWKRSRNISEASGSINETPRKTSSIQIESVHSSSDRDLYIPPKIEVTREESVDLQEKVYNILKKWFDVWKGMFLCGDVSQCTIYFPLVSLSAIGSQGIQEAVESAVNKEHPPDIMVITLPFANIRSAHRQSITKYLKHLPVSLPETIWSSDRSSFPWTMSISDMSCYTIQFGNKLIFLKPVSLSATVGLSTRPSKESDVTADTCKPDIGYLGVCVHIDMTPILISTSEVQVYLFASILYGLTEVLTNLIPEQTGESLKTPEVVPVIGKTNSTVSPTEHVSREKTPDSVTVSDNTPPISSLNKENLVDDSVKLTAWVQWTITRFTIELLSNEYGLTDEMESMQPRLKLVVDAEDIVSSLDFQSVYLKIKSKIGSASIQHYKRSTPNSNWKPGSFSGIVMRLREDVATGQRHEDNGFISITITRASCQHTHTLWGAVQKRYNKEPKRSSANPQFFSQSRYITEIVVNIQPIDFVISLKTLRSFYLVVVPLLQIPIKPETKVPDASPLPLGFNNQTLPLAYLEFQDIRVIIPSVELVNDQGLQDAVVFQIQKICLTPSAVNPICRPLLRPDIYEQAAHARILNIPGSDVEDRQYQLDLLGISVCTSTWDDVQSVFIPAVRSSLKGVSENPALEWNNIEQGQPNMNQPMLNLWHVTEKFDISLILAPAMVYKEATVICGHSVEINIVTDILVNLSLQQIKLISCLLCEFVALVEPLALDDNVTRPKITLPYSKFVDIPYEMEEKECHDLLKDSGIDTSDIKSVISSKIVKTLTDSEKYPVYSRQPHSLQSSYTSIPIEILFTAGKIGLALYQVDFDPKKTRGYKKTFTKSSGNAHRKSTSDDDKRSSKNSDDVGYEAEEEDVEDKEGRKYTPLLCISLSQPNAFMSRQQMARKMQISCFDFSLKLNDPAHPPIGYIPSEQDYSASLLETRSGNPAPNTGIFPAFFTLKYSKGLTKSATLDIDISKPTKILCSTSKWGYLLLVKSKVLDAFKGSKKDLVLVSESTEKLETTPSSTSSAYTRSKAGEGNTKFLQIKDTLNGINNVNMTFAQIVFCLSSDLGHEVQLSTEKICGGLVLSTRPEKVSTKTSIHCLTLTVINGDYKKLLVNPWTVTFDVSLFWESWQSTDSDPQIQMSIEGDAIMIDVSPEQLKCVEIVTNEINEFTSTLPFSDNCDCKEDPMQQPLTTRKVSDKEQHYKDDLRAGAFQFVDAITENTEELPLPYQVMFWNKRISAMAWRYPQPRALTKVRVFPVPYKMTLGSNSQDDLQVLCHLEYWSDCRNCYLPFTQFYLSESEVCHLTLPNAKPQPIVASTWRVVITMVNNDEDASVCTSNNCTNSSIQISPRALAACMRIDSYFNKSLIPSLTAALYITKIDISLYNNFNKDPELKIPSFLTNFSPDYIFPENQKFLTLTWYNITGYLLSWDIDVISAELNSALKCNILDYNFLTEQPLVEPFTCKLEVNLSDNCNCSFVSKPIQVKFGPNIAHTLAVAAQVWDQAYQNVGEEEKDFIVMTRLIVCNDSNVTVRFGQSHTDEEILLPSRHFHLYSWRSQKKTQQLRLAVNLANWHEWVWSKSFSVFDDGMELGEFKTDQQVSIFISIKSLSATQKKITIFGQLIVANMLMEHFEMKVVEAVAENKEVEFKNTPTLLIPSSNSTPSIFLNNKKNYYLRLRFYGLNSAWTGDIPLKAHHTGSQPWLVKVPLQERGQFLSIWCRIVTQEIEDTKRILAVLWPLFTVRSNLPISSNIHIETPTLNVHLDSTVQGRGCIQQLYCPGTIDHSHQLTFKIDNQNSSSNPYVPLNYSLVDQQTFFKNSENGDIEENLAELHKFNEIQWPFFGDELDDIDWIVEDQPLTHVQVRYQNACPNSCSLLVELLPWCLTVNTLGVPISFMLKGTELCRIPHHGIVAPPKLEENFNLGISLGGSWYYSDPLQLAKSDWSQSFYMPVIIGTLPIDGFIKTAIHCDASICSVSIMSSVINEMRLLRVSSTHVLTNQTSAQLQILCLAVPDVDSKFDFPVNAERYSFTLGPCSNKSQSSVSIIKWHTLMKKLSIPTVDYALYFSFSTEATLGWSCPIRVDKPFLRKPFCITSSSQPVPVVLTCQEHKGQIFLSLHHDNRPQVLIANRAGSTILCAQSHQDGGVEEESKHFSWHCKIPDDQERFYNMPALSEKFPELPQYHFPELLSLAIDPGRHTRDFQWSPAINIAHNYEQYIRIPFHGDIKVMVVNTACTTFVTLQSASQMEISASDIRVRLSLREQEQNSLTQPSYVASSDVPDEVISPGNQEDLARSKSDSSISDTKRRVSKTNISNPEASSMSKRSWSESNLSMISPLTRSMLVTTLPMKENWSSLVFNLFVKSFSVIFISDLKADGWERWEVASLVCDNIVVSACQTEKLKIKFSILNVQFDNQMYSKESYDFPVLLIGQEPKEPKIMNTLNIPLDSFVDSTEDALLMVDFTLETWNDKSRSRHITGMRCIKIDINPISMYIEDAYVTCLMEYFNVFSPTNLILWPTRRNPSKLSCTSGSVAVPDFILWQCAILSKPLTIRNISLSPVSILLSVHYSIKLYVALDQSPLQFGKLERRRLFSTPYRLGHALAMHYLSDAIFGAGWVVSSLELLGSPGGLARAMGTGLRDFVSLPYRGFIIGPMAFLRGITQGSASLMKHITAGTLQSVTKLASSVARNLDRLTMDEEHQKRAEEQRRYKPQGLAQGFLQGLTGLGISLLGAIGGVAHHPLQFMISDGVSPRSLVTGVGLGLVGMFTKPLSGAAELVALTGQGLLQGAGWNNLPESRSPPFIDKIQQNPNSTVKYLWKNLQSLSTDLLYVCEATSISNTSQYEAIALILTKDTLIMVNIDRDVTQKAIKLSELTVCPSNDPTLLVFKLIPPNKEAPASEEEFIEMDPDSRARVADYVKSTAGFINVQQPMDGSEHSDFDISPLSSPGLVEDNSEESPVLTYYVNLQSRNYFLCVLDLAQKHRQKYTFPVL